MQHENKDPGKPGNGSDPRPNHVIITINNVEYEVHPGNHPVVELKNLGGVPKEETLCILVNGEIKPLDDKDHIDIKGGEIFASNTPSGGAS
ncbi:MAG: hypothetical protein WC352_09390 [Candidatus Omnitrophota bacterium]|jgi:hypothetical protein